MKMTTLLLKKHVIKLYLPIETTILSALSLSITSNALGISGASVTIETLRIGPYVSCNVLYP